MELINFLKILVNLGIIFLILTFCGICGKGKGKGTGPMLTFGNIF